MATSPKSRTQPASAEFSILALGGYLGELKDREHRLDHLSGEIGREHKGPGGPGLTLKRLRQRRVEHAKQATYQHIEAIEQVILTSRASCFADAAVQMMVAASAFGRMTGYADTPAQDEIDVLENALESVLRVLTREAGIELTMFGGAYYASAWCEVWPDVDVSGVKPDGDPAEMLAIDEPAEVA